MDTFIFECLIPSVILVFKSHPLFNDLALQEFVWLLNAKRRSIGCQELKWNSQAAAIASATVRTWSLVISSATLTQTGKRPFDRFQEANMAFSAAAENIGPWANNWPRNLRHQDAQSGASQEHA